MFPNDSTSKFNQSRLNVDPEWLHHRVIQALKWLDYTGQQPLGRWMQAQIQHTLGLTDARLSQNLWGLDFSNPVGLAAGFDKDGLACGIWSTLGFGFAELGTVTFQAQPGNPRPRLFRLTLDDAALNRMGFNNRGAAAMAALLQARAIGHPSVEPKALETAAPLLPVAPYPLGINLGKSKVTPLEDAATDYVASFRLLQSWGDYFVVNVSSPNTPGLRSLQAADQLEPILDSLQQENQGQKPLLIKISPDLEWDAIVDILNLVQKHQLAGIIATNTTVSRAGLKTQIIPTTGNPIETEAGGISGAPLRQRSTEVIRFIWQHTQGTVPIVGVGGIFTAEDAWEKITAGASLVQVYTGWIYEGPGMVRRILEGLLQKLAIHNLSHLSQAVGQESLSE